MSSLLSFFMAKISMIIQLEFNSMCDQQSAHLSLLKDWYSSVKDGTCLGVGQLYL